MTASVILSISAAAPPAQGADPAAPPGASAIWLPPTAWVLDHWLPYDETSLLRTLGMTHSQVLSWLGDHHDHRPLLELARMRGVPLNGLAARLVGARPKRMSRRLHETLIGRAKLTLTQPHLAHHILGHLMHVWVLLKAMPSIFGRSLHDVDVLRTRGLSFTAIAQSTGVSETALRRQIMTVLGATQARAEALGQTPRAQARFWLDLQRKNLTSWLGGGAGVTEGPQLQSAVVRAAALHRPQHDTFFCHLLT